MIYLTGMQKILVLRNLSKVYDDKAGKTTAIDEISLSIEKGDIYGIIGLSGAGKSTLIRCINRLEEPNTGQILFTLSDGKEIDIATLKGKDLMMVRKRIAMIFQSFNLFQQRNAFDNVLFPLETFHRLSEKKRRKIEAKKEKTVFEYLSLEMDKTLPGKKEDKEQRARELLELVGLSDKEKSYPSQLSGGQQQRVAIARALALHPDILLSDESTSALDPKTTQSILKLLKDINQKTGLTIILITHQMSVIEAICNKVAIIDKSHIVEEGFMKDVFAHPKSEIARQLLYTDRINTNLSSSRQIRLFFDGNSDEPIVALMIEECHTLVNILYADTKVLDNKTYGQMVLQLPEFDEDIEKVKKFLTKKGVKYQLVLDRLFKTSTQRIEKNDESKP